MIRPLILLTFIPLLAGCGLLFGEKFIEPKYDLRDTKVLVVPFKKGKHWYYESIEGGQFAEILRNTIHMRCSGARVVDANTVEFAIADQLEDPVDWAAIGDRFKIDYIVLGRIKRMNSTKSLRVGMLEGMFDLSIEVFETKSGTIQFRRDLKIEYPGDIEVDEVIVSFAKNKDHLKTKLFDEACDEIADDLCGYTQDRFMGNN